MSTSRRPRISDVSVHVRPKFDRFLDWCAENEVELHPELEICPSLEIPAVPQDEPDWTKDDVLHLGMSIKALKSEPGEDGNVFFVPIAEGPAARIPRSAILSPQSSSLRQLDPSFRPPAMGGTKLQNIQCSALAVPRLALCVLHEYLLGPASRWWPYLATLPPYGVDLPRMWRRDSPEYALISGSEVGHTLQRMQDVATDEDPDHCATDRFLRAYFDKDGANHLVKAHPTLIDLEAAESSGPAAPRLDQLHQTTKSRPLSRQQLWILYDRAASLVSTRAFVVDLFHVLAMVPIADAWHPDVEFICHDVVCTQCGSRRQCEHWRPEDDCEHTDENEDPDDALLLDGPNLRRHGMEVYNSYGELLPIPLLIRYGWSEDLDNVAHGDFAVRWACPLEDSADAIELREALKLPEQDISRVVDVVDLCLATTRDADPRHFHYIEEELADDMGIPAQDPILEKDSSDPSRPYFLDSHVINDRLWLLVLAAAVEQLKPGTLNKNRLLKLNAAWWQPKRKLSEPEQMGQRAIKILEELVKARIAKITTPFSSDMLSEIDRNIAGRTYVGSSATGAAARCVLGEKRGLDICLYTLQFDVARFERRQDLWRRYNF
ncbi:hypothetical protein OC846_003924 [Tilletia horrida]|uniref:SET domain-containing protein n=1 Tax=Tilletia horrida TaxID=155126 RepID=A0AAN6GRK1_9BASI|nr:hypothetical protein OC846_003924 [Tilletia horrida]